MDDGRNDLKARQVALYREVAGLVRDRGAEEWMTPTQAVASGLLSPKELDLLTRLYGVRIWPGERITLRGDLLC
jgi:hypothetical protein